MCRIQFCRHQPVRQTHQYVQYNTSAQYTLRGRRIFNPRPSSIRVHRAHSTKHRTIHAGARRFLPVLPSFYFPRVHRTDSTKSPKRMHSSTSLIEVMHFVIRLCVYGCTCVVFLLYLRVRIKCVSMRLPPQVHSRMHSAVFSNRDAATVAAATD